jgi:UDP-N-acetyl-D-mannosaminuronate dehydrogenase
VFETAVNRMCIDGIDVLLAFTCLASGRWTRRQARARCEPNVPTAHAQAKACVALQIVFSARGKNLFFSAEPEKWIAASDCIFVSVNTPTKTKGVGSGKAADLSFWEGAARMIAGVSKSSKIVVEKSTVPVKTAEAIGKVRTWP